jgi:soluble lytic murein transglycosylase-like protein
MSTERITIVVGLAGLLLAGVSALRAEGRTPGSDSALNQTAPTESTPRQSAEDVMDAALRDLDLAVRTYQGDPDSMARAPGLDDSALRKATNQEAPTRSSAAQAEWEDLLLVPNPRVQSWQEYFSAPASPRLVAAFYRLLPFRESVADILSRMGLPQDLIAVAFVESELANSALSPKGAKGAWQFMPATAARYGLELGTWIDERTDFEKSTAAAARYLADLHELFGDWALALAAYNAGEDTVRAAILKGKTRSFVKLSQQGLFPGETQEYVPKVLAAARAWKAVLPDPAVGRSENALAPSTDLRQGRACALSSNGVVVGSAVLLPKSGSSNRQIQGAQSSAASGIALGNPIPPCGRGAASLESGRPATSKGL